LTAGRGIRTTCRSNVRPRATPNAGGHLEATRLGSMPPTPIDRVRIGTSDHLALPSIEGVQHFFPLRLWHLEVIKGAAEFGRDLIKHLRGDLQVEMRVAQLSGRVLEWSSRHRGDPQRP